MKSLLRVSIWACTVSFLALLGVEAACYLFPRTPINRPYLNRLLQWPEFQHSIHTNSLGLREDSEISKQKQPKEYRTFILGDSFAFGLGLEKKDTLSEQLQSRLQETYPSRLMRVFNAASPGTGPLQYTHSARKIALKHKADLITLLFFVGNDLENTTSPYLIFPYTIKNYLKLLLPNTYRWTNSWRYTHLIAHKSDVQAVLGMDTWSKDELHRWGKWEGLSPTELDLRVGNLPKEGRRWLKEGLAAPAHYYAALTHPQILNDTATLSSKGMQLAYRVSERTIENIHQMCKKAGAEFLLVIIPASYQEGEEQWNFFRQVGYNLDPKKVLQTAPQDRLGAFCERKGIAYLDLLPALRHATRPVHFERDEHWRPYTVAYVAELLSDLVINKGWINK